MYKYIDLIKIYFVFKEDIDNEIKYNVYLMFDVFIYIGGWLVVMWFIFVFIMVFLCSNFLMEVFFWCKFVWIVVSFDLWILIFFCFICFVRLCLFGWVLVILGMNIYLYLEIVFWRKFWVCSDVVFGVICMYDWGWGFNCFFWFFFNVDVEKILFICFWKYFVFFLVVDFFLVLFVCFLSYLFVMYVLLFDLLLLVEFFLFWFLKFCVFLEILICFFLGIVFWVFDCEGKFLSVNVIFCVKVIGFFVLLLGFIDIFIFLVFWCLFFWKLIVGICVGWSDIFFMEFLDDFLFFIVFVVLSREKWLIILLIVVILIWLLVKFKFFWYDWYFFW